MDVAPRGQAAPARPGAAARSRGRGRARRWRQLPPRVLAPLYLLYTHWLRRRVTAEPPSRHVAVIRDGNRRWAGVTGLREAGAGHRGGAGKLDELLAWCAGLGIPEVTVWALSSENLSRGSAELDALFEVLAQKLTALARPAGESRPLRIRVFGRIDGLPRPLAEAARRVQEKTAGNDGLCLNVALGYSGRDELVDATRSLVRSLTAAGVPAAAVPEQIDAAAIASHLYQARERRYGR